VSRIGRMPIPVPSGVQVQLEGNLVTVKGDKGELVREFHPDMSINYDENTLVVSRPDDSRNNRALHGLTRALLANMVTGVSDGFSKRLVINGVGYRATMEGADLVLQIGFSHPVRFEPPEGISFEVDMGGHGIIVAGRDKELVGEMAARVRAVRKPEPYKGKGIAYDGEVIRRKAGKAGRVGGV